MTTTSNNEIQIIGSSSKGNGILYFNNTVLVDCGLTYTSLEPYLKNVKIILLTHIHGDHFNTSTIAAICSKHPSIRWVVPAHLEEDFARLVKTHTRWTIVRAGGEYRAGKYYIKPVQLFHDVPNVGYIIIKEGFKLIHATDTNMIKHIDAPGFDLYAIECNYDEVIIDEKIRSTLYDQAFTYEIRARENHLSFQKTTEWYKAMKKESSRLIPLHISHSYDDEMIQNSLDRLLKKE